jgi:acyl carrier protein
MSKDQTSMHTGGQTPDTTDSVLRAILCDVLGLDVDEVETFTTESGLFGHLPELDSMAVASLLTELEDRLGILIDDEDIDGEMLETFGGLLNFAVAKRAAG